VDPSLQVSLGDTHPETLTRLHSFAQSLRNWGKYYTTEMIIRNALKSGEAELLAHRPEVLQLMLSELMTVLVDQQKLGEAEELWHTSLETFRTQLGEDSAKVLERRFQQAHPFRRRPEYKDSSGSTISTDRTTSAIHTTAATSLGSHSSNGQNGYEAAVDVQPGQKRKRTATRLQIANEDKERELETNGDAFTNYKPPPRPPIKAPDVQVKQVADVNTPKFGLRTGTNW
jgi:ribosomal protein S7